MPLSEEKNGTYTVVPRIAGGEITPDKLIAMGAVAKKYDLYTKITGGQRIDLFGAQLQLVMDHYECEWANVLKDPVKLKRFPTFVNDERSDPGIHFVKERGQNRPVKAS